MYFDELGSAIEKRWRAKRFVEDYLPSVAASLLAERPPAANLSFREVVEWAITSSKLPKQARLDEAFGQPPLTVYWNDRFRIDVLFWHTATTGIHQHQFSGAFTLLTGSSVHSSFSFEFRRELARGLHLGEISLCEVEILTPGAVREIAAGPGLIHSLFHLDAPTLSVVVRTPSNPAIGPELECKPPDVAIDPSHFDPAITKKIQLLRLLLRVGSNKYEEMARLAIRESDLYTVFMVLRQARVHHETGEVFSRLVQAARKIHGSDVEALLPSLDEEWRRSLIISWRSLVSDSDLKFFLALLLNVPNQAAIVRLISCRHPDDDPLQLIEKWCAELSTSHGIGVEFDETLTFLFRCLLKRMTLKETLTALRREYSAASVDKQRQSVEEALARLRESQLLRPLFV